MKRILFALFLLFVVVMLSSCGTGYVISEMKGTAKPEGGISETIPETKTYTVGNKELWKAVQDVLDEQGYIFAADSSSGRIKTDPKILGDPNKVVGAAATYSSVVAIKVENSSVTYKARFNKKSNIVESSELREYPEKENELRRDFFAALDKKITK